MLGGEHAGGAAQIALVMLVFVVGLIWIERSSRARQRFHHTSSHVRALPGYQLTGARRAGAVLACALPILLGFVVPASVLGYYAFGYFEQSWTADFLHYAGNSLKLSLISALVTVAAAVLLGYAVRLNPGRGVRFAGGTDEAVGPDTFGGEGGLIGPDAFVHRPGAEADAQVRVPGPLVVDPAARGRRAAGGCDHDQLFAAPFA